jgi:hypothetical protein
LKSCKKKIEKEKQKSLFLETEYKQLLSEEKEKREATKVHELNKKSEKLGLTPYGALSFVLEELKKDKEYLASEVLENIISKDASASLRYAKMIKKGRFERGEKEILGNETMSIQYQKFVRGESGVSSLKKSIEIEVEIEKKKTLKIRRF